ncbi:hypothetical protein [Vibrio sp. D431a]|uniref:hypothetical protein n=1 Tax=Vibrio sp. D431a TaxID=2837388 RepID=UPI002552CDFD|nr:hypothetical protein [Vibrio sp. D431a]MDK9789877.1 hypothetical protein [Vibrio sp. D431a]
MIFKLTRKHVSADNTLGESHIGKWAFGCPNMSSSPVVMMGCNGKEDAKAIALLLGLMDHAREYKGV